MSHPPTHAGCAPYCRELQRGSPESWSSAHRDHFSSPKAEGGCARKLQARPKQALGIQPSESLIRSFRDLCLLCGDVALPTKCARPAFSSAHRHRAVHVIFGNSRTASKSSWLHPQFLSLRETAHGILNQAVPRLPPDFTGDLLRNKVWR